MEATYSATREERTDVSMRAEDVEAASLAATTAAVIIFSMMEWDSCSLSHP